MLHLTPGFLLQCITQAKSSARFIVHVSKVKYISVVSVESKKKNNFAGTEVKALKHVQNLDYPN